MKKILITSFLMFVFASGFSQGEELLNKKKHSLESREDSIKIFLPAHRIHLMDSIFM